MTEQILDDEQISTTAQMRRGWWVEGGHALRLLTVALAELCSRAVLSLFEIQQSEIVRMSRKGYVGVYESISRQKSTEEHKVHGVPPFLHFNKLLIAVMFLISPLVSSL